MADTVDNLILDLLEWLGTSPRPYSEVLDACANVLSASTRLGGSQ